MATRVNGGFDLDDSTSVWRAVGSKLSVENLRDQAARAIRAKVIAGVLAPDRLYSVAQLSAEWGVSATPVREALLDLASDGLVEIVRNRGFRVRPFTERDLDEVLELRRMLEVPAVRTIAEQQLVNDEPRLREMASRIDYFAQQADFVMFLDADRDFHLSLLECGGNLRLVEIVRSLRDQTRLYGLAGIAGSPQLMESSHEHSSLLDAVVAGDGELATQILSTHLDHTRGLWAGLPEATS